VKLNQLIKSSSIYRRLNPMPLLRAARPPKSIFGDIYAKNEWGGATGTLYSGSGSRGQPAQDYVLLVTNFIVQHNVKSVLDLGCGDFFIGRQIADVCEHYIGVDVVPSMIEQHRDRHGSSKIDFQCLDITRAPLPLADLCLIRQVLQHLSNKQIASVVQHLSQFTYVIVTEHFPHSGEFEAANRDKAAGSSTRVPFGSAVVLDQPPFAMKCTELMNVPAPKREDGIEDCYTRGSMRTFLVGG
jgi:SAM-dependent methyltransferase